MRRTGFGKLDAYLDRLEAQGPEAVKAEAQRRGVKATGSIQDIIDRLAEKLERSPEFQNQSDPQKVQRLLDRIRQMSPQELKNFARSVSGLSLGPSDYQDLPDGKRGPTTEAILRQVGQIARKHPDTLDFYLQRAGIMSKSGYQAGLAALAKHVLAGQGASFDRVTDKRVANVLKQADEITRKVTEGRSVLEQAKQLLTNGKRSGPYDARRLIDTVFQSLRDLQQTSETTLGVGDSWLGGTDAARDAIQRLGAVVQGLRSFNREIWDFRTGPASASRQAG